MIKPDAWTVAMRAGRYADAWALGEKALAERDPATRDDPCLPYHQRWVWDGRPFDDRDVLVRCYHGLGDTIQFARFLPELARRARRVTVEAPARLIPLLRTIDAPLLWSAFDPARPCPASDCDIEVTELDFALRRPPGLAPVPYLSARRALVPGGTVGICAVAGDWDRERAAPEALFGPLCHEAPTLTLAANPTDLPVLNPEGCPLDMEATAGLIAAVELVITVDTMVAHLAGALGRPTWLLLKAEPDWRWHPGLTASAWYPSIRQYVQPAPGDWESVMRNVTVDLAHRSSRSRTAS